jgi:hypothetical protein
MRYQSFLDPFRNFELKPEILMGNQHTRKLGWRISGIRISGKVKGRKIIKPDTLISWYPLPDNLIPGSTVNSISIFACLPVGRNFGFLTSKRC